MRLRLKTLVYVVVIALSCVASFYLPDGAVVVILIGGVIMYILSQS